MSVQRSTCRVAFAVALSGLFVVDGCNSGGGSDAAPAPTVLSVSPTDGAIEVALDATLPVSFDSDMDPTTIDASTFVLFDASLFTVVPATVTYDPVNRQAVLVPDDPLDASSIYSVVLTTDIRDVGGVPLRSNVVWAFGTIYDPLAIPTYFARTGQTASGVARLDVYGGITTTDMWSGLVEVHVSGTGFSTPPNPTDAFYGLDSSDLSIMIPGSVQGLRISSIGCATSVECGAPRIDDFIVFAAGEGLVTAPHRPAYASDHVYRFVIDVGPAPQYLTLGEGDGGVSDNSGEFVIDLYAVELIP